MASARTIRPNQRWRTLSLRALMLLIALLACWLAWVTNRARAQREAIETIERAGGIVLFDDVVGEDGHRLVGIDGGVDASAQSPSGNVRRRTWLQQQVMRYLGDDYVRRVYDVSLHPSGDEPFKPTPGICAALSSLPDVIKLYLDQCDLDDADLVHVRKLSNLRTLVVSGNPRVTDAGLENLRGLRRLRLLNLYETGIGDAGLAHLAGLSELEELYLGKNRFGDTSLYHLRKLQKIRSLDLGETGVGDDGMAHLQGMRELSELELRKTRVGDAGMAVLSRMPALDWLDLSDTLVGDRGVAEFVAHGKLKTLVLDGTQVTDISLDHVRRMPGLTWLGTARSRVSPAAAEKLMRERKTLARHPILEGSP